MSGLKPLVHLVGSIPLADANTVFETVTEKLGQYLDRIPDGETGKRLGWIKFLETYLNQQHPDMETDTGTPPLQWTQWDGQLLREVQRARFKQNAKLSSVKFDTGYASDAIISFATFDVLQTSGIIPAGVKFQICIPTPLAPAYNFVVPHCQDDFIPIYTNHIVNEVEKIAKALPNDRIAIQWDVCQEVLMWEGYYDYNRSNYKEEIFRVLGIIGDCVPNPIELGYHLCYGSPRDEHLVQPRDTKNMVEIMNGLMSQVIRNIDFLHIPVPKSRDDDAYFKPLKTLQKPKGTELYFGLIHHNDMDGDRLRFNKAKEYAEVDGIGTECGWGRGDPARIAGLLESHAQLLNSI